jgi:glyoxylase-like metal-dependent hydrolase (beta-lactamase superfamily II)
MSDGVTLIYEPYVHPFLRCNIWHVRGRDADLLIDTGLGVASLRHEIGDLVDRPLKALATHIHYDHVGGLHEFDERIMHRFEAPLMTDYKEHSPLRISDFPKEYLETMQAPEFDELLIRARPSAEFNTGDYQVKSAAISRTVDEGDVIDLGNRHFEVFHLPGHSPGSIGLWEQSTGTLFSGDAIYDGLLLDELRDSDIPDYIQTMKRLRALPVSVVHGGHEPSFGRPRLIEIVDQYLALRD